MTYRARQVGFSHWHRDNYCWRSRLLVEHAYLFKPQCHNVQMQLERLRKSDGGYCYFTLNSEGKM